MFFSLSPLSCSDFCFFCIFFLFYTWLFRLSTHWFFVRAKKRTSIFSLFCVILHLLFCFSHLYIFCKKMFFFVLLFVRLEFYLELVQNAFFVIFLLYFSCFFCYFLLFFSIFFFFFLTFFTIFFHIFCPARFLFFLRVFINLLILKIL